MKRIRIPKAVAGFFASFCIVLITLTGQASAKGVSIIRDTEIENTLRLFSAPIFKAAGLNPDDIAIHIVNDPTLNAFVAGGQHLFIDTGLLMRADNASEVIGVIAHETGHIAGGHLVRMKEELRNSTPETILAMILGGAAAVMSGQPGAASAVIGGASSMRQRSLLAYTRTMERSADQAGVEFLNRIGMSPQGLLSFMEILKQHEAMSVGTPNPYLTSHPLTEDRIEFLEHQIAKSKYRNKPIPANLEQADDRMRAKLKGYLQPLALTLREYPETDHSVPARYARSIAYMRVHRTAEALALVDGLIAQSPKDPFFYELRGDILRDAGRIAESVAPYRKAIHILPWAALIRVSLAQSLLELDDPASDKEALQNLSEALRYEPDMPIAWRLASTAYSRQGDEANVMLSLAEEAMLTGKKAAAKYRADRAAQLLPNGSAGWMRAQDIKNALQKDNN